MTLVVEMSGSKETIVQRSSTLIQNDEVVPISLFEPQTLYDRNQLRTSPNLICVFRTLHDGFKFQVERRQHYHHFLGAFIQQNVLSNSEFRFRSCVMEPKGGGKIWKATGGHLQFWRGLNEEHYPYWYTKAKTTVPITEIPGLQSPQIGTLTQTRSTNSTGNSSLEANPSAPLEMRLRLVLYLCEPVGACALIVVSLSNDTYLVKFSRKSRGHPSMSLERRSGKSKIPAAVFSRPDSKKKQASLSPDLEAYPGIPMSDTAILSLVENSPGIKNLTVEFMNEEDMAKFEQQFRQTCKPPHS
ncbi:hypothetical protein P154DRAFT_536927 [Amniculicola lignicola CBS 123094]|uniref:Uncharacterized protein n=1 Tax=Amniculicola lignicola CBS 123094 TaxID=1392246 RepID=A0A6A5W707_9PLEO|nr:hypothetical protein P154DRAFT_536927 [Amniculicola lignicola CBS 123094]